MMPPRMPKDYRANFRKALPQTPGHEQIEQSISREPIKSIMEAES
jgi:pyruvate dehydrogenase (quinone)